MMDAVADIEAIEEPRCLKQRTRFLEYFGDDDFKNRVRLSKKGFFDLAEEVEDFMPSQQGKKWSLTIYEKLWITLRFFASNCLQSSVGDFIGIHKTTVSKTIHDTTEALCCLKQRWIKMFDSVVETKTAFHHMAGFPGVIGCIDCSHVKIRRPDENAEEFVNRKGVYSINVQVVCDHKLRINDIVCRWPGSVHDSRIFDNSTLKHRLETNQLNGILLGDSGYACKRYLLTPVLRPRNDADSRYNRSHTSTRITVERCFGVLKRHFLCLEGKLRYSEVFCCKIILACAIVHNFIIEKDCLCPEFSDLEIPDFNDDNINGIDCGSVFRNSFIQRHFV